MYLVVLSGSENSTRYRLLSATELDQHVTWQHALLIPDESLQFLFEHRLDLPAMIGCMWFEDDGHIGVALISLAP